MLLKRIKIEGYRSLRRPLEVHVDPNVTVVLGANDHGKSNLLAALSHLNPNDEFMDDDLNWDCADVADTFPSAEYEFVLSQTEREEMREVERLRREEAQLDELRQAVDAEHQAALDEMTELQTLVGETEEALENLAAQADSGNDEVPSAIATTKHTLVQKTNAYENAQRAVEETQRRADLIRIKRFEVKAGLEFTDSNAVLVHDLGKAHTALNKARSGLDQASASEASAREALTATETQGHAEGSNEHTAAKQSLDAAVASLKKAQRTVYTRQATVLDLERIATLAKELPNLEKRPITLPSEQAVALKEVPTTVLLSRTGLDGDLKIHPPPAGVLVEDYVLERLPMVYVVEPQARIPDSATAGNIGDASHAFMRGIFHYAGLDPHESKSLFVQSDQTSRQLDDASAKLNTALRESWSQGERLEFRLQHNAASKKIELVIKDPAVRGRFVRASRRSSGFTHFFALKTVLHALQKEASASSYLWVFDEPGVYLHPDGQHDLVTVMETLAQTNQVVYSTHSVFMASKNFPARHRLVIKTTDGTQIDGKPFRSRWRPAIDALGMSLPGTFLFASHVLLVEGDSDSILLNATLQKLLELGHFDHDVTPLSVMSAGDPADAAALVRILRESVAAPRIHAVFDGDDGGKKRKAAVEDLGLPDLPVRCLKEGTTTEDHLPGGANLYLEAVAAYLGKFEGGEDPTTATAQYADALSKRAASADFKTGGLATWTRSAAQELAGLNGKPSPVGIAREYALLLTSRSLEDLGGVKNGISDARTLCQSIARTLGLPNLTLSEGTILEGDTLDDLA